MENNRRVMVTGIGVLTPWGRGVDLFWRGLLSGEAVFKETSVNIAPLLSKLGGEIADFKYEKSDILFERGNKFCKLATIAGEDAISDANLSPSKQDFNKIGVIASTVQGHPTIGQYGDMLEPLKAQYIYYHIAAGLICVRNKIKGPTFTIHSGEASGSFAVGWGLQYVRDGRCDVVIVGASDVLSRTSYLHYSSLKELSPITDSGEKCIPFDHKRNGIILSEGSAFLVLEEYEHAKRRGANIYGEIAGFGSSHDTNAGFGGIDPTGKNIKSAMKNALEDSQLKIEDIGVVYGASNGSLKLDVAESSAIKELFEIRRRELLVSSIKSLAGESLSAGGILNIITALFTLNDGLVIPVIKFDRYIDGLELNYVANEVKKAKVSSIVCNAVSYGGNNVSVIVKRKE